MNVSRISKVAGVGVAGFIVAAGVADRLNIAPNLAQVAGFVGAFVGSLVANRRTAVRAESPAEKPDDINQPKGST